MLTANSNNHDHYASNDNECHANYDEGDEISYLKNNEETSNFDIEAMLKSIIDDDESLQDCPLFVVDNVTETEVESSSVVDDQAHIIDKASTVTEEITLTPKLSETETSSSPEETGTSKAKKRKRNSTVPVETKAVNFPISSLEIGSYKRQAIHNEQLVAKCFFKKKKLAWEVLEGHVKVKFEISFSDIDAINSTIHREKEVLMIRLKKRPKFFRESKPQPRKHSNWQDCTDFTNQVVSTTRVHRLEFDRGVLKKHYSRIINSDPELLKISAKKFPSDDSPLFDDVHIVPYTNNTYSNCNVSEFSSNFETSQQPLPVQGCRNNGTDHNVTNFARNGYHPITSVRDVPNHHNTTNYASQQYSAGYYAAHNPVQHNQFPFDQGVPRQYMDYPIRQLGTCNNHFPEFSTPFSTDVHGSLHDQWSESPTTCYPQLPTPPPIVQGNTITNGYHAPSSHHNRQSAISLPPFPSNGYVHFSAQPNHGSVHELAAPTNAGTRQLLPSNRPMEQHGYGNNKHLEIQTAINNNGANHVNGQL